jgi:hypothetical protein
VRALARCELDIFILLEYSLGHPQLHSPSLACRVFLIKTPYSSKTMAHSRSIVNQACTTWVLAFCKRGVGKGRFSHHTLGLVRLKVTPRSPSDLSCALRDNAIQGMAEVLRVVRRSGSWGGPNVA